MVASEAGKVVGYLATTLPADNLLIRALAAAAAVALARSVAVTQEPSDRDRSSSIL
jgi:L-aminopeptidase/D-esterase-like protein